MNKSKIREQRELVDSLALRLVSCDLADFERVQKELFKERAALAAMTGESTPFSRTTPRKGHSAFAAELSDAYSTDRYLNGWGGCILMLRKRGFDDREVEAIIRSKWTRWAGDMADKDSGCTSTDLARFLDKQTNLKVQVAELVAGTFQ